ncbi:MAG: glycosyltransferase family 4 protein [Clostridia bacterium]|nr:glycosyltransferase family 4 protein [Clostridia bacterium]
MKKVLLVATVQSHIAQFHKPLIALLKERGDIVHVAARNNLAEKNGLSIGEVDEVFDIPFARSPLAKVNLKAYKMLKKVIDEGEYDIVHCNTPMGGVLTRLAAKKARKKGTKVFYTAHGFHFYRGARKRNWLVYYPIEKCLAKKCDVLITITEEDYALASKKFKTNVVHVHGVGVNTKKYSPFTQEQIDAFKAEQGLLGKTVLLCTGELNKNKNQITAIKAVEEIKDRFPETVLLLAGNGPSEEELRLYVEQNGLQENVKLLGYRTDLEKFVYATDIVVSASYREGLPLNVMEAMICKKPVVASKNRGHNELVRNAENGFLVDATNVQSFADGIAELIESKALRESFGERGYELVQKYTAESVVGELKELYK